MTQATREDLIERYTQGYAAISGTLEDITPAELDAREVTGE